MTQGKRRIPFFLRQDLRWWYTALLTHNGLLFFDDINRPKFQLFTDACLTSMGGFYYTGTNNNWRLVISSIQPNQAFVTSIEALNLSKYINFYKVNAILEALKRWGKLFYRAKLVINIDNINAFYGLQS